MCSQSWAVFVFRLEPDYVFVETYYCRKNNKVIYNCDMARQTPEGESVDQMENWASSANCYFL